jgi:hypothetical protein
VVGGEFQVSGIGFQQVRESGGYTLTHIALVIASHPAEAQLSLRSRAIVAGVYSRNDRLNGGHHSQSCLSRSAAPPAKSRVFANARERRTVLPKCQSVISREAFARKITKRSDIVRYTKLVESEPGMMVTSLAICSTPSLLASKLGTKSGLELETESCSSLVNT